MFKVILSLILSISFLFSQVENNQNSFEKLDLTKEEKKYLHAHPILRVQNLKSFPPFNFYESSKPQGFTIDYLNLVGEKLGVKIEYISNKPWKEYLLMLKDGSLDIIPHIAINEERKKFVDFTSFDHITYTTGVVIRKDKNYNSISELNDKTIAVAAKTFLHTFLNNNFPKVKLYPVSTTSEALDLVSLGKVDAAIGSLPSLQYYIQENWLTNLKITGFDDIKIPKHTHLPMGVKKGNLVLKSILEKVHISIPVSKINSLKQKWISIKQSSSKLEFTLEQTKYLNSKKEISMCVDPDWMPFEKIEDGKHIGMSADYVKLMEDSLGIPINLVETKTWLESLEYGKQRKCDIFSLVMPTPEREKYLLFTEPYIKVPLVIATKAEQAFINDIPSLTNSKIGLVKGYAYSEILRLKYPHMKFVGVDNLTDGLIKVERGEIFGFIGTLSTVGYHIQKDYIGTLKIAGKFDDTWDLGIGVRDDEPILKDIFNNLILNISKDESQKILNKWISVNFEKGIDYTIVWQISLVFLFVLIAVIYKNRAVNKINIQLLDAKKEVEAQQEMVNKYVLILTTDIQGTIIDANEAFCKTTGFTKEELVGNTHKIMKHEDMSDEFFTSLWKTISDNKHWSSEIKNYTKDKRVLVFNVNIEPIIKDGKKIGYRSISEDITDKKRIEELSITDKLTGLYNRLKLDEIMISKIEEFKRYGVDFSVILLDVDDFKSVNDTYGHDVGDHVLQKLSKILKDKTRASDVVGRWGGEEFVVVCSNTDLKAGLTLAEHLRKNIEEVRFKKVGSKTISLGVTQFKKDDNLSSIFKRVDDALYEAKNTGKNKVISKE